MATQKKKLALSCISTLVMKKKKKTCDETADLVDVSRVWVDN